MSRSINDKSTITKIGLILTISLVLILSSCTKPQTKEPELHFTYEKYEDGSAKELGMMVDSLKEGLWITFHPNGKIHTVEFFKDGKWNGPLYNYHKNGKLSIYRETKDGVFHGEGYNYFSNGIFAGNVNFIYDKADGIFEDYDDDGQLIRVAEFKNGEFVRTIYGLKPFEDDEE